MKPVHGSARSSTGSLRRLLTANVEEFATAASNRIWTGGKLHAGDTRRRDHPRAESRVLQVELRHRKLEPRSQPVSTAGRRELIAWVLQRLFLSREKPDCSPPTA